MANTRDILGDKATLAGLVGNTLTELEEDSVPTLRANALMGNDALTHIKLTGTTTMSSAAMRDCTGLTEIGENDLPSVVSLENNAFANCSNLSSAIFPSLTRITSSVFSGCPKLTHLVLAGNSKCNLLGDLKGTLINVGMGAVYVPSDLVNTYKTDLYWNKYLIVPLSSYPLSSFDTISDSWDTIISYANAGTIGDHYSVGDNKVFTTTNNITYYAELVGINKDPLSSDSTKTANSSWILKTMLSAESGHAQDRTMNTNPDTTGGWGSCELRTYLNNTWILTLPTNIQNAIKTVNKPYYQFEDQSEPVSADRIWIPSSQEVGLTGINYLKETTGIVYSDYFTDSNSRTKYYNNMNTGAWWVRSAFSSAAFIRVTLGSGSSYNANNATGILVGFCI